MAMPITVFQERSLAECRDLLRHFSGVRHRDFEKVVGKKEIYFKLTAEGPNHVLEIYVYQDEAGYMLDGKRWTIFEKPDYRSESDLQKAFLSSLREKLQDIADQ
jgi:hypothetical protein